MLAIRLFDEIESRLDSHEAKLAEQRRFMCVIILAHLEDLEDYYFSAESLPHAFGR
ncbi:hypothetical protein [Klebsiella pneumoniae]|uniref:hypothetical protein n=1 Tax=Klebsiella pneumoniae TaxID=573 RepID=UPI0022B65846|nr:hypothetical protein [Klebsiella pneumoniae]